MTRHFWRDCALIGAGVDGACAFDNLGEHDTLGAIVFGLLAAICLVVSVVLE
jgi:hypothetical protein